MSTTLGGQTSDGNAEDHVGRFPRAAAGMVRYWAKGVVAGVSAIEIDGRPHVITAGKTDDTVRIWDLINCTQVGQLDGHTAGVNAVAAATVDGRPVCVSASDLSRLCEFGISLPAPKSGSSPVTAGRCRPSPSLMWMANRSPLLAAEIRRPHGSLTLSTRGRSDNSPGTAHRSKRSAQQTCMGSSADCHHYGYRWQSPDLES